jgi:hypothetical protein
MRWLQRVAKRRPLALTMGLCRGATALFASLAATGATPTAAATCVSLARLGLPDTTITADPAGRGRDLHRTRW